MKVGELCSRNVATVERNERIIAAARRMCKQHVGDLVVVELRGSLRVPVGILTDRDIVVGVLAQDGAHLDVLDVGDVVSSEPLVTATSDEDVGDVLHRMRTFGVRRVPVVGEQGELEGILALDDVVVGLADELGEAAAIVSRQLRREGLKRP